jgi:integrase
MKVGAGWKWHKLFTDKRASQKRWEEIVSGAEQRAAGVITPQMDAASVMLDAHVHEYLSGLKNTVSDEHYRIASYMLRRFVSLAGWKILSDISQPSAERVIAKLKQKHTVSYCNQYLTRVKAFIHWCIPERLLANPLPKLRRGNVKKSAKRRARRPLGDHELTALLKTCPPSRMLKYAIPAFTGLRRKELSQVVWGDLHLDSVIPYLALRSEITKTGQPANLPLHPFIVSELRKLMPGMPAARLFSTLPEGRTMLRDLTSAGVTQADSLGRRADYHALRHTFAKRLDASGCSHATRRALMRHSSGDQTDDYTLARLSEMYEAVRRLGTPNLGAATSETQVRTGTDDRSPLNDLDTGGTQRVPEPTAIGKHWRVTGSGELGENPQQNGEFREDRPDAAAIGLIRLGNPDTVQKTGPRSSVG